MRKRVSSPRMLMTLCFCVYTYNIGIHIHFIHRTINTVYIYRYWMRHATDKPNPRGFSTSRDGNNEWMCIAVRCVVCCKLQQACTRSSACTIDYAAPLLLCIIICKREGRGMNYLCATASLTHNHQKFRRSMGIALCIVALVIHEALTSFNE